MLTSGPNTAITFLGNKCVFGGGGSFGIGLNIFSALRSPSSVVIDLEKKYTSMAQIPIIHIMMAFLHTVRSNSNEECFLRFFFRLAVLLIVREL